MGTNDFYGASSIILPLLILNLVETWAPTNKIIGAIPDFTVLIVAIFQPWHNTALEMYSPNPGIGSHIMNRKY